jgi:transcriptional regulator with XRE-family HTH domain
MKILKMENISLTIGRKLKKIRQSKNITIDELSRMISISQQQIARYERGYTKMSAETIYKISLALNCSINSFFLDLPGIDETESHDKHAHYLNSIKHLFFKY